MKLEIRSLSFDNLLVHSLSQPKEDWQEGFFMMENFTLNADIYKNGPVFFSVTDGHNDLEMGEFTYYLPINETVELSDETDFHFLNSFQIERALVLRQADEEMNFTTAYQKIKSYAEAEKIELEDTYYCVLLEVYNEYIIDLYVPLKGTGR